jgi:exopolyphosphatase/guanosine-5'-triphosphate,3'-diphosphate pyrophosphatase
MRDAHNRAELCEALSRLGLEIEVIAGTREAQLSFCGALSGFGARDALGGQIVLVVDVGGGSTELICGKAENSNRPTIFQNRSFNVGSRRLTDRFLKSDPPRFEEILLVSNWVEEEIKAYFDDCEHRPQCMIAVAGTATSVVSVRDAMVEYEPWKVHGSRVSAEELEEVLRRLAALPLARRSHCLGLEPGRAPVIIGGLITLQVILRLAGLDAFTVSETDILQGILLDTHEQMTISPCTALTKGRRFS